MVMLKDLMSRNVESVGPDEPLADVARRMDVLNVSMLPVCEGRHLVGALTRRHVDAARASRRYQAASARVRDVMIRDVVCGSDTQDVKDALRVMRAGKLGALPVLDAGNELVGIFRLGI
jgi:CBS domain-containing protein